METTISISSKRTLPHSEVFLRIKSFRSQRVRLGIIGRFDPGGARERQRAISYRYRPAFDNSGLRRAAALQWRGAMDACGCWNARNAGVAGTEGTLNCESGLGLPVLRFVAKIPAGPAAACRPWGLARAGTQQSGPSGGGACARGDSGHLAGCRRSRQTRARSEGACRQPRRGGFFQDAGAAPGHPRARARPLFLLPATDQRADAVHRSRGAAGRVRAKFLPQPGFLLCGLQCEERRTPRDEFLRQLYRERCLSPLDLAGRLRALDALTSGKLRPQLPAPFFERCTGGL
jgi:hypothetical protein